MDIVPDYCRCRVLILGCGNILLGDDGFGPKVIEYFKKNYKIPDDICIIDAGCRTREILFMITLSEIRPQKIIIVDAVDIKKKPGKVFEIDTSSIPANKIDDFSMHQLPTSNLLRELKEFCKIEIIVLVTQVEIIPKEVCVGISKTLVNSIPKICEMIMSKI